MHYAYQLDDKMLAVLSKICWSLKQNHVKIHMDEHSSGLVSESHTYKE